MEAVRGKGGIFIFAEIVFCLSVSSVNHFLITKQMLSEDECT